MVRVLPPSMKRCNKHPHSSDATAQKCYEETMRRHVARKMRHFGVPEMSKYVQIKYDPPQPTVYPIGTIYAFYGAVKKSFGS